MSEELYDVIVVGAGPAGSYAAYKLTSLGYKVAVLERKTAPGTDVCCTGIISTQCFHSFGLSSDVILTKINSITFFSPSGKRLRLQTDSTQAYVVDRSLFDKEIASKAQSQGACYFFDSFVSDVLLEKDRVKVEALCPSFKKTFASRAIILANGFRPRLPQKLGLGRIKEFLVGAQTEIEIKGLHEPEIYLTQETAPGSFAWIVPISENKARVGFLSHSHAKAYLQKFLFSTFCQNRIASGFTEIKQKAIPMTTLPRSYGDRVLVIGDAAGQVKPTTGGGIYFGHLGAEIATEVLDKALHDDDLAARRLSIYQRRWKREMGQELSKGRWIRRLLTKLGSNQVEEIFETLDSSGVVQALLRADNFSFDWHTGALLAGLKYALPSFLRRRFGQIFEVRS